MLSFLSEMNYVNRVALTILYIMITVVVFTSVMTFIEIDPALYNPYLYFIMLLLVFQLVLS